MVKINQVSYISWDSIEIFVIPQNEQAESREMKGSKQEYPGSREKVCREVSKAHEEDVGQETWFLNHYSLPINQQP